MSCVERGVFGFRSKGDEHVHIWGHLEASGIIWDHLESSGLVQAHLGSSGIIWDRSSGIFWLGSSGIIWDHMGEPWGPVGGAFGSSRKNPGALGLLESLGSKICNIFKLERKVKLTCKYYLNVFEGRCQVVLKIKAKGNPAISSVLKEERLFIQDYLHTSEPLHAKPVKGTMRWQFLVKCEKINQCWGGATRP